MMEDIPGLRRYKFDRHEFTTYEVDPFHERPIYVGDFVRLVEGKVVGTHALDPELLGVAENHALPGELVHVTGFGDILRDVR